MATSNRWTRFLARIRRRPQPGMSDAEVAHRLRPHGQPLDFGLPVELDATIPPDEIHLRQDGETVGKIVNVDPAPPAPFSQEWYDALPPEGQEAYDEWRDARMADIPHRGPTSPPPTFDAYDDIIDSGAADIIRDRNREGK